MWLRKQFKPILYTFYQGNNIQGETTEFSIYNIIWCFVTHPQKTLTRKQVYTFHRHDDDDDDDVHLYGAHIHADSMLKAQEIGGKGRKSLHKQRLVHSPSVRFVPLFKTIYTDHKSKEVRLQTVLEGVQCLHFSQVLGERIPQGWATVGERAATQALHHVAVPTGY